MAKRKSPRHLTSALELSTQGIDSQSILEQIKQVNKLINCADLWFENEKDEALIESCIYQREALNARYKYLLTMAKEQNLKCGPF